MKKLLVMALAAVAGVFSASAAMADAIEQTKAPFKDAFRQLEGEEWPTPNDYRTASGAPGYRYWQQKVDYRIQARLDEAAKTVTGKATITYRNNSPDRLAYLWLLLDQNIFRRDFIAERSATVGSGDEISLASLKQIQKFKEWEGGFKLTWCATVRAATMPHTVVDSLMRVDLPQGPAVGRDHHPRGRVVVPPLNETKVTGARNGYECFTKARTATACSRSPSGSRAWRPTTTTTAGSTSSSWAPANSRWSSATTTCSITVPADHVVGADGRPAEPGRGAHRRAARPPGAGAHRQRRRSTS